METWDEFLNFISSEIGVHHKKDQIKISQFTKFLDNSCKDLVLF